MTDLKNTAEALTHLKDDPVLAARTTTHKQLDIAINSLNAWDSIKHELVRRKENAEARLGNGSVIINIETVLEMIDEHLSKLTGSNS